MLPVKIINKKKITIQLQVKLERRKNDIIITNYNLLFTRGLYTTSYRSDRKRYFRCQKWSVSIYTACLVQSLAWDGSLWIIFFWLLSIRLVLRLLKTFIFTFLFDASKVVGKRTQIRSSSLRGKSPNISFIRFTYTHQEIVLDPLKLYSVATVV